MGRNPADRRFARFVRTGDPADLAAVFDATASELGRVARHLARDPGAAEDLVQETFLVAIERREAFDSGRPVTPWLLGILANLARRRSRQRPLGPLEGDALAGPADEPSVLLERIELSAALRAAVRALPPRYRDVLVEHLERGRTPREIAAASGQPDSTVRNQLARGLERLRRALPAGALGVAVTDRALALDGVRAAVLERAAGVGPAAAAAGSVPPTLAVLMHTKLALIFATAALVALGFLAWPDREAPEPADLAALEPAPSEPLVPDDPAPSGVALAPPAAGEPATGARAAAAAPAPDLSDAALVVRVKFERDGAPAAGVAVSVLPMDGATPGLDARTDGAGVARFDDLAALDTGFRLVLCDRGASLRVAASATEVDLAIPRGLDVAGRVVDPDGAPVAGATVYASAPEHPRLFLPVAEADADGRFAVRDLGPTRALQARADGRQPSQLAEVTRSRSDAGEPLELVLGARGYRLFGTVRDALGAPVPHALVVVGVDEDARELRPGDERALLERDRGRGEAEGRPLDMDAFVLRADARGRFETTEAPLGGTLVVARGPEPGDARVGWARGFVGGGPEAQFDVRVAPGASVLGSVRDGEGRPQPGLRVVFSWDGDEALGSFEESIGQFAAHRVVVTDADGEFEALGLLPGEYDVLVEGEARSDLRVSDDHAIHREDIELGPDEVARLDVSIPRHARVLVRVTDGAGAPLEGVGVLLGAQGGQLRDVQRTGADGACLTAFAPVGPQQLALHRPDPERPGEVDALPTLVVPDFDPEVGEATFVLPATSASLRGVALDAAGAPLAGCLVVLKRTTDGRARADAFRRARTADDGAFAFDALAPGEYQLELATRDIDPTIVGPFDVPAEGLDLGSVRAGAGVSVAVSLTPFVAPEDTVVRLFSLAVADATDALPIVGDAFRSRPRREHRARFDRGVWRTDGLAPRRYLVTASRADLAPAFAVLDLPESFVGERAVALRLGEGTPAPFRFEPPEGAVADATLAIDVRAELVFEGERIELWRGAPEATRAPDGALEFALRLPPGEYRVTAWVPTEAGFEVGRSTAVTVGDAPPATPTTIR